MVIAEFRIMTRPHRHDGNIGVRQNGVDGLLETGLDLFVEQHGVI